MALHDRLVDQFKAKQKTFARKIKEETKFIRELATDPSKTGAISPSGEALAETMASFVDVEEGLPVLELGPGTGAITRGLLRHGVAQEQLHLLEYSDEFCRHLGKQFPKAELIQGSAYELDKTLRNHYGTVPKFAAVISSLPLLNVEPNVRRKLLDDALSHCHPGAPYIQFSYGWDAPIRIVGTPYWMEKTGWILRNVPPARVFVYGRKECCL